MGEDGGDNVFECGFCPECRSSDRKQVGSARADDVDAEKFWEGVRTNDLINSCR